MSTHTAVVRWNRPSPDFCAGRYSREHTWRFDGGVEVPASPSPHVVPAPWSNPAHVDPEEAFVASMSSCHMLTFLYLASKAGFAVRSYEDSAEGVMTKNEAGKLWVSAVALRPRIVWDGVRMPTDAEVAHLHEQAHEECFIANSVRTDIRVEPPAPMAVTATAKSEPVSLHVVDAFTDRAYAGNPAAVCRLAGPADEAWMRDLAREMNLSETSFLHPIPDGFSLRWLTPSIEVKLCGHATLAAAHTLWTEGVLRADEPARFLTASGWLTCRRDGEWIEMDFPALATEPVEAPAGLIEGLGTTPVALTRSTYDYVAELADEAAVRALRPDFAALARVQARGIIVTAQSVSGGFDFVSRFFAPAAGIDEDPVTGSAHCALGPYWRAKLGRDDFTAFQASARGGVVKVGVRGDRVLLRGRAVSVSRVELTPPARLST